MIAGSIADPVLLMTRREWLNEEVSVPWEKKKRSAVEIATPPSITAKNFKMNLNWNSLLIKYFFLLRFFPVPDISHLLFRLEQVLVYLDVRLRFQIIDPILQQCCLFLLFQFSLDLFTQIL